MFDGFFHVYISVIHSEMYILRFTSYSSVFIVIRYLVVKKWTMFSMAWMSSSVVTRNAVSSAQVGAATFMESMVAPILLLSNSSSIVL